MMTVLPVHAMDGTEYLYCPVATSSWFQVLVPSGCHQ